MPRQLALLLCMFLGACAANQADDEQTEADDLEEASQALKQPNGKKVFHKETFDGNGRTCSTCHLDSTGTINPAQIQALHQHEPCNPLFRPIDSDDGQSTNYSRLLSDASFRIPFTLPPNVTLLDNPSQRVVYLRRAAPTVNNIALEPVLMHDGRENDLATQAIHAVNTHDEPGRQATAAEGQAMADYQRTLFSRPALKHFAQGGPPPELPHGKTEAEKRGRAFFEPSPRGFCGQCHGGPLLNTTNEFNFFMPPGERFATNFSAEFNAGALPVHTYQFTLPDGSTRVMVTPDPGRALVSGNPCEFFVNAGCANLPGTASPVFKIPTLWGISQTAPYFHDGSAHSLEELMNHYQAFFAATAAIIGDPTLQLTEQDKTDIIAFLKLL